MCKWCWFHLIFVASLCLISCAPAADWFAGPQGKASNPGTKDAPWELAAALGGAKKIAPGDTLWLLEGTYKHTNRAAGSRGYEIKLAGSKDKPIIVRAVPGARVTIDGGMVIGSSAAWLWLRDLEIIVSEPLKEAHSAGIPTGDLGRPWGGVEVSGGTGFKFINLVIHDNLQGMALWTPATECEVYGCVIYDNGWRGPDRGHGHCIYTQNKDGVKIISNCIMQARFDGAYTLHAYGSERADADNFVAEENICYERGPFLIGSGKPSHNIKARANLLYGVGMCIGYAAPENEDCEVRDNVIVNGDLRIKKFKKVVKEGNLVLAQKEKRPAVPRIVFLPNKYDDRRAHLAVFNFPNAPQVAVKMEKFLKAGAPVRLMNPKDLYGKPVWEGKASGDTLNVPTPNEFNVYVVMIGK